MFTHKSLGSWLKLGFWIAVFCSWLPNIGLSAGVTEANYEVLGFHLGQSRAQFKKTLSQWGELDESWEAMASSQNLSAAKSGKIYCGTLMGVLSERCIIPDALGKPVWGIFAEFDRSNHLTRLTLQIDPRSSESFYKAVRSRSENWKQNGILAHADLVSKRGRAETLTLSFVDRNGHWSADY